MNRLSIGCWICFLVVGLCALTGCDEDPVFTERYRPPPIRIQPKEELTVRKPTITFIYSPVNKRDPFRPSWLTKAVRDRRSQALQLKKAAVANATAKTVSRRPRTPLEQFELDQLKVVAIVTGISNPMAMVEDPKGKGYVLRRGSVLGRNGGRVTRITSTGVVVSEVYRDVTGKRISNRVTIRLKKQDLTTNSARTDEVATVGRRKLGADGEPIRRPPPDPQAPKDMDDLAKKRDVDAE